MPFSWPFFVATTKISPPQVAEKPSVAKFVAESLCGHGRLGTRKGQSRAVQVFEFVGWFPPAQQTTATEVGGEVSGWFFWSNKIMKHL